MRWYWLLAIVLVIGLGAYFYLRSSPTPLNYPSEGSDIIAFGDSLVSGTGGSGGGFVSLLSDQIDRPIINLGRSGDTTASALTRLSDLDSYKPKVILLLLGGNDYLKRVPTEETFENLGKIIEDIQKRGAVVLLLGVRGGILNDRFDSEFKKLSIRFQTAYVPNVLDGLLGDRRYMSDQIHPNDAGYSLIAEKIAPVLKTLLK